MPPKHHPTLILLTNALALLPTALTLLSLQIPSLRQNETANHISTFLATASVYTCASAGATWLCRNLGLEFYRKHAFLLKCVYSTCVAITLSLLVGPLSSGQGWLGGRTAMWVGLVLGGVVVDKIENAKEAGAEIAMGEGKAGAEM
ncbi:hypothetical protein Q7P37_006469 [Cladosporium fusiforme]